MSAARQQGIALVIVLWVTVLLTVIVSSFVYSARGHVLATGNLVARTRAEALADAGIHRGISELFKFDGEAERWQPDGQAHEFELAGGKVAVGIIDEASFIDLNNTQEVLLKGLILSAGVEEGAAQSLLDAILDWRDGDDLVRLSGAERDQYQEAGLKTVPANANFRTLDELKAVLGVTPDLYQKLSAALTVHSGQAGINPATAPRQVLMAIPDVDPEAVDAYLATRAEALAAGLPPPPFPPAGAFSATGAGVYNLRSVASLPDGTVFVREAVVRVVNDPQRPVVFFDWKEGRP